MKAIMALEDSGKSDLYIRTHPHNDTNFFTTAPIVVFFDLPHIDLHIYMLNIGHIIKSKKNALM